MKKYLLLSLVSFLGYSQQVLKKITSTSESTTVELYTFRNGTSSGNVVGNENFSGDTTFEDINFYTTDSGIIFSSHVVGGPGLTPLSETVCNGTFQEIYWTGYNLEFCDNPFFCDNAANVFPINVFYKYTGSDEISDNNDQVDLSKNRYVIPTILNNGGAIPTGTWVVLGSRRCADVAAGLTMEKEFVCLRFDGTAWILQTTYPNGAAIPDIADVCTTAMGIADGNIPKNDIALSPNPARGFITVQKKNSLTEIFLYSIIDLSGKTLKTGTSKFGAEINIADLPSGNYMIQIKDELGFIINKKLIKE